ncbi:cadherin-like domain-containing protein, partial [Sulfurovum sp.]|uniref:Ig-like domain-containing protein n=1 Tax=Sulfurovum sp. TaxID=1969726 RepID=UPI0025EFF21A
DSNGDINASSVNITTAGATDTNGDGTLDTLVVTGEGNWSVDPSTGAITFTPEAGFTGDPTPIEYIVADDQGNISDPSTVTVMYPGITVEETGAFNDTNGNGTADVGETITYTFLVMNTGQIPLTDVMITDNNADITGGPIDLGVGESDNRTFAGVHVITIDDLIAGEVLNQATAMAKDPNGNDVTDISDDPEDLTTTVDDPTIIPIEPTPPTSANDVESAASGEDAVIDIIKNDTVGVFPLDTTTVTLTEPANAEDVLTGNDGDVIGFTVPSEGTWSVDEMTGVVTFNPENGYVGDPTAVQYTVEDEQGNPTTSEISINYPPVANDDSMRDVPVGETVTLTPLLNDQKTSTEFDPATINFVAPADATGTDTDGDGDIDHVMVADEGIWTANPDGTVTFDPDGNLEGNPTPIGYTVKELSGDLSNEATLSITYVGAAARPVANDDTLTVTHYGSNLGTVVDNDTAGVGAFADHTYQLLDANGQKVPYGQTIPTEHGTVSMEKDGTFIYSPEANYDGSDAFNYVIIDTIGQTDSAQVMVDVECASTQTSDSGDTLGTISMLMIVFMTIVTGLYFTRREEIEKKKRKEA